MSNANNYVEVNMFFLYAHVPLLKNSTLLINNISYFDYFFQNIISCIIN